MFRKLFRTPKKVTQEQRDHANDMITSWINTEKMKKDARVNTGACIALYPTLSFHDKDVVGWCGGYPSLPEDMKWPRQKEIPLKFVAQINLEKLPQNLWNWQKPKSGSLAFFVCPQTYYARAIYINDVNQERVDPSPSDRHFVREYMSPQSRTYLPKIPIAYDGHVGTLPSKRHDDFETNDIQLDFGNIAWMPYTQELLQDLFGLIIKIVERNITDLRTYISHKDTRDEDHARLDDAHSRWSEVLTEIKDVNTYLRTVDQVQLVDETLRTLHRLVGFSAESPVFDRKLEDGSRVYAWRTQELLRSATEYEKRWFHHTRYTYFEEPQILTNEARTLFETLFQNQSNSTLGGMGHAPEGHIYTPHGPNTENEVLLELNTSNLMEWTWGDCYSVVLLMNKRGFKQNKFGDVILDITN